MRGKANVDYTKTNTAGITPAYAGKSCFKIVKLLVCEDHPRLCGEKFRLLQASPL